MFQDDDVTRQFEISYSLSSNSPWKSKNGKPSPLAPLFAKIVENVQDDETQKYFYHPFSSYHEQTVVHSEPVHTPDPDANILFDLSLFGLPSNSGYDEPNGPSHHGDYGFDYLADNKERTKREVSEHSIMSSQDHASQIFPNPFIQEQKSFAEIFHHIQSFQEKIAKATYSSEYKNNPLIEMLCTSLLEKSQVQVIDAGKTLFKSSFPNVLVLGTSEEDDESLQNLVRKAVSIFMANEMHQINVSFY